MKLLTALRSEMLKTTRTASFYFTIIMAALIPAILLLNVLTGGGDLKAMGDDTLNAFFQLGSERTGIFFFPLFLIMVCTLQPQSEYRNNTWKQVFASPQSKGNVFIAKFININLLIVLFLIANLVFMSLVIVVTHFAYPAMNLLHRPFDAGGLLIRTGNSYVLILALCTLQFWLGLRFRNFIIPTSVGLVLWIIGMILVFEDSSFVTYYPYSFQSLPAIAKLETKLPQVAWTSVGYATLLVLLAFLDFRKRRPTT